MIMASFESGIGVMSNAAFYNRWLFYCADIFLIGCKRRPYYVAPEVVSDGKLTKNSDVYRCVTKVLFLSIKSFLRLSG